MKSKSSTTTETFAPVHPGEILAEEFLKPLGLTAYRVASDIGVPAPRINDIVLRRRGITADTAVRLARYFGTTDQFWLNLQSNFELAVTRAAFATEYAAIRPRLARTGEKLTEESGIALLYKRRQGTETARRATPHPKEVFTASKDGGVSKRTVYRDSRDGQFTTRKEAERDPSHHEKDRVPTGKK